MPSPWVKKLVKETGKSETEVEKLWGKAKAVTAEHFSIQESDFDDKHYGYAVGVVKKMSGLREYVKDFVNSELSAREFIETVISGDFNAIHKDGIIKKKGAPKQFKVASRLTPDLKNMEHSDEKDPKEGEEMDWGDIVGGTAGDSQGGDGGGVGGESVAKTTPFLQEEDSDEDFDFDFLNEIEVK